MTEKTTRASFETLAKLRTDNRFLTERIKLLQNENRKLVTLAGQLPEEYRNLFAEWLG